MMSSGIRSLSFLRFWVPFVVFCVCRLVLLTYAEGLKLSYRGTDPHVLQQQNKQGNLVIGSCTNPNTLSLCIFYGVLSLLHSIDYDDLNVEDLGGLQIGE